VQRHDLLQARVMPRPMRLGPHLTSPRPARRIIAFTRDQMGSDAAAHSNMG
jgi:hypothetical protein